MIAVIEMVRGLLQRSYAPLVPLVVAATVLLCALLGLHLLLIMPAHNRVTRLEEDWLAARRGLLQQMEARQAREDLARVLQSFPAQEDFVRLGLSITKKAESNQVTLPSLSYKIDKSTGELAKKAAFQGSVTGRYEDVRRFIHQLEMTDEFLFIEDLDVVRARAQNGRAVTFQMSIATYLKDESKRGRT